MPYKLSRLAFVLLVCGMMFGCTTVKTVYVPVSVVMPPLPANIKTPPPPLSLLEGNTGKDVLNWFKINVPNANQCYVQHQAVVDLYEELRIASGEKNK